MTGRPVNRRRLLAMGAAAGGAVLLGAGYASSTDRAGQPAPPGSGVGTHTGHHGSTGRRAVGRTTVPPFTSSMPVPPVLRPVSTRDGDHYQIPVRQVSTEIVPGQPTPVLSYGDGVMGPTIRARTGRPVRVTVANQLGQPTNVHLHGGHVAAEHDGHPMDLIEPGRSRTYEYPNSQQGATLWYHDHAHHLEAEHVYLGLHGFYLIEDPIEAWLGLPSGEYDVPIALRDAHLDENGQLYFDTFDDAAGRSTILVNGVPRPYFPVAARKYRFRLLNSANERVFRLRLAGDHELVKIASDGGLLPAPERRPEVEISSGERCEVVVDFARYAPGTSVELVDAELGSLLRFDVVRRARDRSRVPDRLRPLPALPTATTTRDVSLSFAFPEGAPPVGQVDGRPFDPSVVNFQVKRGSTEIWQVHNADVDLGIPHNFHLHLAQFRVLDRDGKPPRPDDAGWKDTVRFLPGERTIRVQATFTEFLGRYVYHCHFLEHSSLGMMAQMEVVP